MAFTLRFDEMLEAARDCDMPGWEQHLKAAEAQSTLLARALANHLKVDTTDSNLDLAILGSPFYPRHEGQPLPEPIAQYDSPQEWGEE